MKDSVLPIRTWLNGYFGVTSDAEKNRQLLQFGLFCVALRVYGSSDLAANALLGGDSVRSSIRYYNRSAS